MWKRSMSLIALAVAVLLVTAACATTPTINVADTIAEEDHATEEASAVAASSDRGRVIEVELTEFAIGAESFELTPGETVEFLITNSGVAEHEFRLSNQERVDEHIAGGHDEHDESAMSDEEMAAMEDNDADHDDDEADHEAEADDVLLVLAAGETGTLTFTVPDNDHDYTVAVCLIPGHYEAGMATELGYQV